VALLTGVLFSAGASAQGARLDYAPIPLNVACGELFRAPCAKILPKIATRTLLLGIDLKPVQSGGAVRAVAAVCQGEAAAAIVQRDVAAQIGHQPSCLGRFDVVGKPLYPLYAVLVVKAAGPVRQLSDLHGTVAVGQAGSGGQATLELLLGSDAAMKRNITLMTDDVDLDRALAGITDGSIDGYFAIESLDSDAMDRIRLKVDALGKPLYAFADVRPAVDFLRTGDGQGSCLYRLTALDFGGPVPVTTVSTDAVMVLGRAVRDAHGRGGPRAFDALTSAIGGAGAAILADMRSPADWRPAGTSCH
jgi:hypothetical protein